MTICLSYVCCHGEEDAGEGTCEAKGDEMDNGFPAEVVIVNHGENLLDIYWVQPETNERVFIADLQPGGDTLIKSFWRHVLEVKDRGTSASIRRHVVAKHNEDNIVNIGLSESIDLKEDDRDLKLETLGESIYPKVVSYIHKRPRITREIPMGAKFRNLYPIDLEYYFDDGTAEGQYNGIIPSMGRSMINTYNTHAFILYKRGTKDLVDRITMVKDKNFIILQPDDEDYMSEVRETEFYKEVMQEQAYIDAYKEKTGLPWLSYYPRPVPMLHMWSADSIGQEHLVEITENGHPIQLTLKVISVKPRVFYIAGLLVPNEIDHIISLSKDKVHRSAVGNAKHGGFLTQTRTSKTAWITRHESPTMEKIFSRFSRVLNISDDRLQHDRNAENLQVVHYGPGQKYSPHYDFSDSGAPPQRFLTLFIYLKAATKGGGTGFPLAYGRRGLKVTPREGSAVLWYNMLPDGNGDDSSLHEGMPVGHGEKWGCNLWVWDPIVNVGN